jgi:hypothetical protein
MRSPDIRLLPRRRFHAGLLAGLAAWLTSAPRAETRVVGDAIGGAGPAGDRAEVEKVLRAYLRVMDEQSEASIAQSFHPAAFLMSAKGNGELNAMTQATWWERISRPGLGRVDRTSTIRYIDVEGAAAMARVDVARGGSTSTDFFTLLRLKEGWRIVNKVVSSVIG